MIKSIVLDNPLNCTLVELKFLDQPKSRNCNYPLNCTLVELKYPFTNKDIKAAFNSKLYLSGIEI